MAKTKALLLVMMDMPKDSETEFATWSDEDHVPARLDCPGFLSYRRFQAVSGEPKFMVMYELDDPSALETPEYKGLTAKLTPSQLEQQTRVTGKWSNVKRNVYVEVPTPHVRKS